jgi:DNA ligase-1
VWLDELAETCGRCEATSSRRRKVEILAEALQRASSAEREAIAHLVQGQLRPPYEGIELGIGEKLLVRILVRAYAAGEATVLRRWARLGDLGLVAASLAANRSARRIRVGRVYNTLLQVAHDTGSGSQQRKSGVLAEILSTAGANEARLLVRMVAGRLRLGIAEQTILEAAALGAFGDRGKKVLLEHAFNVRSDLGTVVRLAFEGNEPALVGMDPRVGVPVRPALAQRLPSAAAIIERLGKVRVEPKYDGIRLQIHRAGARVWLFSRRLENVTDMFPELAGAMRRQFRMTRGIIEGEAVVHHPETGEFLPFQITMTRKRKKHIAATAERYPLRLFAFDLLSANARSYLGRPLQERAERLRKLLRTGADDPIALTEAITTGSADRIDSYFNEMIGRGLEGVVAKRLMGKYQAGARGFDWVKLKRSYQSKLRDTVDVVIVGYLRGRGKRVALGIGSLLTAVYDPDHDRYRTVAKVGSGLSDEAWKALRKRLDRDATQKKPACVDSRITPDVWLEPTFVIEVLADEITRSPSHECGRAGGEPGYALRFPRMLGIRSDKGPREATTQDEILELYRMQNTGHTKKRQTRRPERAGRTRRRSKRR